MFKTPIHLVQNFSAWLANEGVQPNIIEYIRLTTLLIVLAIIIIIIDLIAKRIILRAANKLFTISKNKWDDSLVQERVFDKLSQLFPALLVSWTLNFVFVDFPNLIPLLHNTLEIYVVWIITKVMISFFTAIEHYLSTLAKYKDKPIESYFQLAKLITYFISGIFIISVIIGKSPLYLLSAFGAMTAVALLIFKDTILGLVASIQISANDMVRVNDWLEMDKYGADGNVMSITLATVKVQNWDHTITTIPTYALVSDSFKNWRNMQDTGARRIKRFVYIRAKSVRFVNDTWLEKYKEFQILEPYIIQRQNEIEQYNKTIQADKSKSVNGRNLTNIGVFRKYLELYLIDHSQINQNLTLMIRQLQSDQYGIPLEIYCFAKTTEWVTYEGVQSDIMDHVLASAESFGLEVYELNGTTT
jgi:miniconductance mechanosensitive channel